MLALFFVSLFLSLTIWIALSLHNGVVSKMKTEWEVWSLERAAYRCQMWTINKYGIEHNCNELKDVCGEMHEIADSLREEARVVRKRL